MQKVCFLTECVNGPIKRERKEGSLRRRRSLGWEPNGLHPKAIYVQRNVRNPHANGSAWLSLLVITETIKSENVREEHAVVISEWTLKWQLDTDSIFK